MIGKIFKRFRKLICMFVILLMTSHHVLPSPLITNSTLHKRHISLDESEISHNVFTVDDPNEIGNGKIRHKRQECQGSFQCNDDQWCYDNMCDHPCPRLHCETVHPPDGQCMVRDHQPVCVTADGSTRHEEIKLGGGCVFSSDCGENEWCRNSMCEDPCPRMNCGAMYDDGRCSVHNHQPVCKPSDEFINPDDSGLNREEGEPCGRSNDCKPDLGCKNGVCVDPCRSMNCDSVGKETQKVYYLGNQGGGFSGATYQSHNKTVKAECVVWLHIARCAVVYSDLPKHFTEVES
ncbi:uncharacterized protein LOC111051627 [Nilaparvata lugens]|uniref:uncharacterized protein LOC111051627 n=1 Tax=Nilaparvata lugens TaxID=108931 RepID=UPI00193EA7D8|nr:uncharacterized protein LOC111051627 [Nilaparvata lugens]